MKPKNYRSIKKYTITFWCWLGVLVLYAFIPVYLFVKSHQIQQRYIAQDIGAYNRILTQEMLVHPKMDSLLAFMQSMNVDAVRNDMLLETYIADKKNALIKEVGKDSTNISQYAFVLNRIDKMLALKDTIYTFRVQVERARKEYEDCLSNTDKIQQELSYDPSRNFSATH